jgi:hypothetical protein
MQLGDIIRRENTYWLVTRFDAKRTRTADLRSSTGTVLTIPHNVVVEVIGNPSQDWPYVAAPMKPRLGPIKDIMRPADGSHLTLYRDWLPSEPTRAGGSIFLNPKLGLRHGDTILAIHVNNVSSRINIPLTFGTVKQNKARVAAKPKPELERNAFTRLLEDKQIGDEDE